MSYARTIGESTVNSWTSRINQLKELLRSTNDKSTLNEQLNTLLARVGRYHRNSYEYVQINRLIEEYTTVIQQKNRWQHKLDALRYDVASLHADSYQRIDSKFSTLIDRIAIYGNNNDHEASIIGDSIDMLASDIACIKARQNRCLNITSNVPQHSDTSTFSFASFFCCLPTKSEDTPLIIDQHNQDKISHKM